MDGESTRSPSYDVYGRSYARTRATDPRIAEAIWSRIGDAGSVANVGAGAGSYEPVQTRVAIEPSQVMLGQRPDDAAPAVCATAEALPLDDDRVDCALAVLTVHHWTNLTTGLRELARVARDRIVIFTWDPVVFAEFWLVRDYLTAAAETDAALGVSYERLVQSLPGAAVTRTPVPVPSDCRDGFCAAYWRRPERYLDPTVRAGISTLARTDRDLLAPGLARLAADVESGRWPERYTDIRDRDLLDVGYYILTADL